MKPEAKGNEPVPGDLATALAAEPGAESAWRNLTSIGRRDFVSWINEAKQEKTRAKRIRIACEKLIAGKRRPCCYAVVPMDLYRALGESPEAKANWSDLSADEKRDFSDWVEAAKEKQVRKARVEQACGMIAEGKKQP